MKFLSSDSYGVKELAKLCIDDHLYQNIAWTLHRCYTDIINHPEMYKYTKLIILQNDDGENVGVVYHNEEYCERYFGTTAQIFVKPEHRTKGYGKMLYNQLNRELIRDEFSGTLFVGYGITGSYDFWNKMSKCADSLPLIIE